MRVAVIGGGAAGLVTAYLLHEAHEVTLLERQAWLGGNVRTLGGNIPCPGLPEGVRVENGTLGFYLARYPTVVRLVEHLGLTLQRYVPGVGVFFSDGTSALLPPPRGLDSPEAALLLEARRVLQPAAAASALAGAAPGTIGAHLPPPFARWGIALRGALMVAHSTPYGLVDELDVAQGRWMIDSLLSATPWGQLPGGTWSYLERILERMGGRARIVLGAETTGVWREGGGIRLERRGASPERFDRVVLATTPDQVLTLLKDPTPAEVERFRGWRAHRFATVAHHDDGLYAPWGRPPYSEVDVFERPDGRVGYNTALVHSARTDRTYHFAYDLDDLLDPAKVLERYEHRVPRYAAAAWRRREEVAADNGSRGTFHAGAYLGEGLHEGAVASALAVSRLLGGRLI